MGQPPENSRQLTAAQCEQLEQSVLWSLGFLRKLLTRIEQQKFPADDPLRRDVEAAYSAIMGLRMTLHYLACDRMKEERDAPKRRPWEGSDKDTYWESRQKRKG